MPRAPVKGYDFGQHQYFNECSKCDGKHVSTTPAEHHVHETNCQRNQETLTCNFCDETFEDYQTIFDHMEDHLPPQQFSFECLWCRKRYPSERKAKEHVSGEHVKDLEKPLPRMKDLKAIINSPKKSSKKKGRNQARPQSVKKTHVKPHSNSGPKSKKSISLSSSESDETQNLYKASSVKQLSDDKPNELNAPTFFQVKSCLSSSSVESEPEVVVQVEQKPMQINKRERESLLESDVSEETPTTPAKNIKSGSLSDQGSSTSSSPTDSPSKQAPVHLRTCFFQTCGQVFDSMFAVMEHYKIVHES